LPGLYFSAGSSGFQDPSFLVGYFLAAPALTVEMYKPLSEFNYEKFI
jgi:hypothetical protein